VVPVAWEDLDNDGLPEISGSNAPTEPFGVGGQVAFTATAAPEAAAGVFAGGAVTVKDATGDRFEIGALSYFYDSSDLFRIEGVATDLAGFEAALNVGDLVNGVYDPDTADQSTFDINTDNDASLTVDVPSAATTVDAFSATVSGTSVAGYTIRVYNDLDNDNTLDAGEPLVATTTSSATGTWSVSVPLIQNAANNFIVTQRSAPAAADGPYVDVFTITEGAAAAAQLAAPSAATNGGVVGVLDVGDTIVVNFNEDVAAAGTGDTIDLLEVAGGTSVRLTIGTNATATLDADADTITFTVTGAPTVLNAGNDGVVTSPAVIQALGGAVGADGLAVNVAGSVAANRVVAGF
jgi:hypothetical protein